MYVTGGVADAAGISSRGDVVGGVREGWELPNRDGYNETCANLALPMWNRRMLGITGEARYADLMEQVLYNTMLSGMGQDGSSFFYTNVHRRFGMSCPDAQ